MKELLPTKWTTVGASSIAKNTFNPIRSVLETIDQTPHPKKKMIALSIGDPTVFGNLKPDRAIVNAVKESLESGLYNGYGSSTGFPEARAAVAEHVSREGAELTEDDVVLCSGCSCSLDLCITVLANPGDNILIPRPGFPLYGTLATGLGIATREYDLLPELDWEVDLEHMESLIDARTKAIVINNPSNPCGSVFGRDHLLAILAIAERHRVPIIADEIYDHFVFPGFEYIPIASLTKSVPVLSCGGLTKRFLVPGWRLGWITVHDRNGAFADVKQGLKSLSQRIIGANTLVQGALPDILKKTPQHFFDSTIASIQRNAELAYARLSRVPGLKPVMPQGAMYMMVGIDRALFPAFDNDLEIVEALIKEQSVFCLPGKCFNYPDYFRIVLTIPERFMEEACARIEEFCVTHASQELEDRLAAMLVGSCYESTASSSASSGVNSEMSSADESEDHVAKKMFSAAEASPASFAKRRFKRPPPMLRRDTVSRLV